MGSEDRLAFAERCILHVRPGPWEFAQQHAAEILDHWLRRKAENPVLFNGVIHVLLDWALVDGTFQGAFCRTDFRSFLYWRDTGYRGSTAWDCFGSALLRSSEGHVLLGRQRPGNINAGLAYLPGGFIDPRDVDSDGAIHIDSSILREVSEETGLGSAELIRAPGYQLIVAGRLVSIVAELRSELVAGDLRQRILDHIAGDRNPELNDAVIVKSRHDITEDGMPHYTKVLLRALFPRT